MQKLLISLIILSLSSLVYAQKKNRTLEDNHHIYILHGYSASINDHWFRALKKKLENKNTRVTLISFPDSKHPDASKWQKTLDQNIQHIDQNTYFIAHSLGSITLLKFLERHKVDQVGGIILVSGFNQKIPGFSELDKFVDESQIQPEYFRKMKNTRMFISDNDPIVPAEYSQQFAKQLNFPYTVIHNAGHFLATDGYRDFAQLEHYLTGLLSK
nr:alpha/beta hydrolase [Acinetobacter sp. Marseille-Q1620]